MLIVEVVSTLVFVALIGISAYKLDKRDRERFFKENGRYPTIDDYVDGDAFR